MTNQPPVIVNNHSITYTLSRNDLVIAIVTAIFRSRILQVFLLAIGSFNAWRMLSDEAKARPLLAVVSFGAHLGILFLIFVVLQTIVAFANAYLLKHRGVLGEHTLEITDQGLIERTAYNESLHKFAALGRFVSTSRYLYVYVSDNNYQMILRRCFGPGVLQQFEAELRARVGGARAAV